MRLTITINLDNSAFEGDLRGEEVARILAGIAAGVSDLGGLQFFRAVHQRPIFDINGHQVGRAVIDE